MEQRSNRISPWPQGLIRWSIVTAAGLGIVQVGIAVTQSVVLPVFLGQINQVRVLQVHQRLNALNQAQQVYFLDHGQFASQLSDLDLGLGDSSSSYSYSIPPEQSWRGRRSDVSPQTRLRKHNQFASLNINSSTRRVISLALPSQNGLPDFRAIVTAHPVTADQDDAKSTHILHSVICQQELPGPAWPHQQQARQKSARSRQPHPSPLPNPPWLPECPAGFSPLSAFHHAPS